MHKGMYGLVALSAAIILASCSQQPIFWAIEREIELEEPAIRGNVYSVVRCGNDLYAANGNVYKKSLKRERGWEKISAPPNGAEYLASSDSLPDTHIYAMSAHKNDCQVYVLDGTTWKEVSGASGKAEDKDETKKIVIFDNGVNGTGRNAYVRVNGNVYKLEGTKAVSLLSAESSGHGESAKTVAAVQVGSDDYFWNTRAFCKNGTNLYSADGKTIKHSTTFANLATASANTSVQTSENITCLVHVFDGTNEYLIAGTKKGLEQIILEGGVPKSAGILGSNAEAAFGESEIFCVAFFNVADKNAIYAGVGKASASKHNALWAYYPSRDTWNYE